MKPPFVVVLREKALPLSTGHVDRYWDVIDQRPKLKSHRCASFSATYPEAEKRARAYCQFLTRRYQKWEDRRTTETSIDYAMGRLRNDRQKD